ncbi:MAG: cysteine desulfurase family protein [bacterium]|nr:cysteine desulfurase family protein [bacterium]
MKEPIYFDYAAATPLDPEVKRTMDETASIFANPSANYSLGREAREKLNEAKKRIGLVIGATADEIFLTSGGTEANNLTIFGIARANRKYGKHLITVETEHASILSCCDQLKKEGFRVSFCPVDNYGQIRLGNLKKLISNQTTLISLSLASSEIGTIQSISHISKIIEQVREKRSKKGNKTPIYLHSDGSAAAGLISLGVNRLGIDALSLNASKIYGPKGSGTLFVKKGVDIQPIIYGGGQNNDLRSGTENLTGAVGLAEALNLAEKYRNKEEKRLRELRDYLIEKIKEIYPKVIINGAVKKRLASNINLSFEGLDGEDLMYRFDSKGIIVATGAACSASSDQPNRALMAIGRNKSQAQGSLRVTLGRFTTKAEINKFLLTSKEILSDLK